MIKGDEEIKRILRDYYGVRDVEYVICRFDDGRLIEDSRRLLQM